MSGKSEIVYETSSLSIRDETVQEQNLPHAQRKNSLFKEDAVKDESAILEEKDRNSNASISEKDEMRRNGNISNSELDRILEKDETVNAEISLQEKEEIANMMNMLEKDEHVKSALSDKDEMYDTSSLADDTQGNESLFEQETYNAGLLEADLMENIISTMGEDKKMEDLQFMKNHLENLKAVYGESLLQVKDETVNATSNNEILNVNKNISEKNKTIDIALSEKGDTLYETSILSDKDAIVVKQYLSHAKTKNSLFEKEVLNDDISLLEDKETLKENLNAQNGTTEKEDQAKNENELDAKSVLEKDAVKSGSAFKEKDEIVNVKSNMSEKTETLNIDSALSEKVETLYETSSLLVKDDKEQHQNLLHAHTNNEKGVESDVTDLLEEKQTLNVKSSILGNEEKVQNENVLDDELIDKGVLQKDIAVNGESPLQERDETLNVKNNMSEINETVNNEIALSEKCNDLCEVSLSEKDAIVQEQNLSHAQQKDSSLIEPVNDESALLEEKPLIARLSILEKDKQINIENLSNTELNDNDMLQKDETGKSEITLQENEIVNFKSVSEKNSKVKVESALSEKREILHDTSSLSDRDAIVQNLMDAQQNDSLFEKEAINDEIALLEVKEALNAKGTFLEKEKIVIDENLLDAEIDKNLLERVKAVYGGSMLQETDKTVNCENNMSEKDETVSGEKVLQEETVYVKNNRPENETIDNESAWLKCETLYDTSSLSDREILQSQNLSRAQLNHEKEAVNESILLEKAINVSSSNLEKETVIPNLLDAGLNDKSELEKVKAICGESTFQEKSEAVSCKNHVSEKDETMNGDSALPENGETVNIESNISGKVTVNMESALLEKNESLCDVNNSSDTDAIIENQKFSHTKTMINSFEKRAVNDESGFLKEKRFCTENYIQEKDKTISEDLLNVELNDKSSIVKEKTMNVESALQEKDKILNVKNNVLEKHDTVEGENSLQDEVETVNIGGNMLENEDVNSGKILPVKGETINVVNCMPEDEIVDRNLNDTYLLEKHETENSNLDHATVKEESEENDTENVKNTFAAEDENASGNICIKNETVNRKEVVDAEDVSSETLVDEEGSLAEKRTKPANSCGKDLEENIGLSKIDAVESEEYKLVDQSNEHADASFCGISKCQENEHDNSLKVSDEVDCAPTRSRRNISYNLSKDVIPEHSVMRIKESTKSLPESELSLISRSLPSKSLDPPTVELMPDDAKQASSRKKRAETPEVKLKTEAKIAVRSSPRKAAKSIISYKEESRRIPSVLICRPKMSSFKAISSSSSVATEKSDTSFLKEVDKNKLKIDKKIKNGSATSGKNISTRSDDEDGLFDTEETASEMEDGLIEKPTQSEHSGSKALRQKIRSSKKDAVESEDYKSVDSSDNEEHAHASSHGVSTRKKNIRDNSLEYISEVGAPRTRRNIRRNVSKDAIPEHSIMEITENTKSLTDTKLKPHPRSLRAKSLDPPIAQLMSDDAKSTGMSEATSRKKRAQTPEVKLKAEEKIAVRSSPRKAVKLTYKEESRKTTSVSTSRSKMSATSSNSGMDTLPTRGTKRGD